MAILVDDNTRVVIQGITGREASMVARHMLAYGTKVVAGVTPGKGGAEVEGVPVYDAVFQAVEGTQANTSLIYVPPAFVCDAVLEAIANGIRLIVIITENIPLHDAMKMLDAARQANVTVIGPNCVGVINPAARVKLGPVGGDDAPRCFAPGQVGVISRSGGMTAETAWMVKRAGFGVSTAVSIGGDALIGTSPRQLLELFEQDKGTHAVVSFSEPGTTFEEEMADYLAAGQFSKPLVSFVVGRFTEKMPEGTVFGHAGAIIEGGAGKPSSKRARLTAAGAHVPEQFDDLIPMLQQVMK